jgi:hypothetical protein
MRDAGRLRGWIHQYGSLGVMAVGGVLLVRSPRFRKWIAAGAMALCLLGVAVVLWRSPAVSRKKPLPPPTNSALPIAKEPETSQPLRISHAQRGDWCVDVEQLGDDLGTRVRVHRVKDGGVVWQRWSKDVQAIEDFAWSEDGTWLSFVEMFLPKTEEDVYHWRLVLWNTRGAARVFDSPEVSDCLSDCSKDLAFSSENTRLLFRSFLSGGLNSDSGTLWCFHVGDGHIHKIAGGVRRAEWIGPQQVHYWLLDPKKPWIRDPRTPENDYEVPDIEKRPRTWTCIIQ